MTTDRWVYGEGPEDAKVVIVGQCPGKDEMRIGRPFVGPAGDLLDTIMRTTGIDREKCYITNVVKTLKQRKDGSYYSDKANVDFFFTNKNAPREPALEHIHYFLKEELPKLSPNLIIALGGPAISILTGFSKVTQARGKIVEGPNGIKTIGSFHPSAPLRGDWPIVHTIRFDFQKAAKNQHFPQIIRRPRDIIVTNNLEKIHLALDRLERAPYIAWDFETYIYSQKPKLYGRTPTRIGFSDHPEWAISIPLASEGDDPPEISAKELLQILRRIQFIMESNIPKRTQNGVYDYSIMCDVFGIYPKNHEVDTMIAHASLYPELPKDLEYLSSLYTDIAPYKKGVTGRGFMNGMDCAVTGEIADVVKKGLEKKPKRKKIYNFSMSLYEPVLSMSLRGVKCDIEERERIRKDLVAEAEETLQKFRTITGVGADFNPNSPTQVSELLYGTMGAPKQYSKEGAVTTEEDALLRIAKKGDKFLVVVDLILSIRKTLKLISTYLDMVLDENNRFHCSYNIVGTEHGRFSSSSYFYFGGNLQNIPITRPGKPNIRNLFVADDDMTLLEFDLKQAENMVVAWLARDPFLMRAFREGKDVHRETAALIFNKRSDEITKLERYVAKRCVHARNYGIGKRAMRNGFLSEGFDISESEISRIFDSLDRAFPNIKHWKESIRRMCQADQREIETPLGRQSLFLDRRGDSLYRQAYAFIPQSTVAHLLNIIMKLVYDDIICGNYPEVHLLMQHHDAIMLQAPDDMVDEVIAVVTPKFKYPLIINGEELIIPVECKKGKRWGTMEEVKLAA